MEAWYSTPEIMGMEAQYSSSMIISVDAQYLQLVQDHGHGGTILLLVGVGDLLQQSGP